jgi:hypothetical protein
MEDIEPSDHQVGSARPGYTSKQAGAVNGAVYRQSNELFRCARATAMVSAREWRMENGEWSPENSPPRGECWGDVQGRMKGGSGESSKG